MGSRPLVMQQTATVSAGGIGVATVRPVQENWTVDAVTVNTSTNTLEAQCRIYRNYIGGNYLVDSTISGSTGDTSDTVHTLLDGDSLIAVWSGADVGATCNLIVRGTAETMGGGFSAIP